MMSLHLMLPDFIQRQSRRTKVTVALLLSLTIIVTIILIPPHGSYSYASGDRIEDLFGAQPGQDGIVTTTPDMDSSQQSSSPGSGSFSVPADCVQVGDWKTLSATDHKYISHLPSSYPLAAETSFELPVNSQLLYFLARGGNQGGTLWIDDTCARGSDQVKVDVQIYYNKPEVLQSSKACHIQKGQGSNGVGAFTPREANPEHRIYFAMKVRLPPGQRGSQVGINALETDLPNYEHDVVDLARDFSFGRLSLKASNGPMTLKNVTAKLADIRTTNGNIKATLKASQTELHTMNGQIDGELSVTNAGSTHDGSLNMRSQNGRVAARISLLSETQGRAGGAFAVSARTSNDELDLTVLAAPLDSVLTLDAQTSNAAATASIPRTFEGTFRLQTSNAEPVVRHTEGVEDPAGARRARNVSWSRERKGTVSGRVVWEPQERRKTGNVSVKSSNGGVLLVIQ